jgi:hypothetical protein
MRSPRPLAGEVAEQSDAGEGAAFKKTLTRLATLADVSRERER